jgi:hypothetical protein
MIVTAQPITPMPIIALVPIASPTKTRTIPKPPRPFDLELAPDVLVEIEEEESAGPESDPAPLRSSAPPVVRTMRPTSGRLTRGVMAATGAAAGAMLAFAFAPASGSASVPLSRALTTPVVVFTLERKEAPAEEPAITADHRIEAPIVLDLDADKARTTDSSPVAAAIVTTTKRKRPRVVLEHAPYGSIPTRPGERVASYPTAADPPVEAPPIPFEPE